MQKIYEDIICALISKDSKKISHIENKINKLSFIQIEQLFQFFKNNKLLNIFFDVFNFDDIDFKKQTLKQKIKNDIYRNKLQNQLIIHEVLELNNFLNNKNIKPIFLKGVAISFYQYKNFYIRPMNDVDVLVKKEEVYKTFKLLIKNGYKFQETRSRKSKNYSNQDLKNINESFIKTLLKKHHHLPPLIKNNISIEIHYRVTKVDNFKKCPITERIISKAVNKTFYGSEILIPSPDSILIHQIAHFGLNNKFYSDLIAIFDIILVIERNNIDINLIIKNEPNHKIKKIVIMTIAIINQLSGKFENFNPNINKDINEKEYLFYLNKIKSKIFYFQAKETQYYLYKNLTHHSIIKFFLNKTFPPKIEIRLRYKYFGNSIINLFYYYILNLCHYINVGSRHLISSFIMKKDKRNYFDEFIELDNWLN